MYKNLFFDFNGTLLDDCDISLKILNILTKQYGLKEVSEEEYLDIFTFPVSIYYEYLGFKAENQIEIGAAFHKYYDELSPTEAKVFDSAYYILNKYQELNLICLSASNIDTLTRQLKYYDIYKYFDVVLGLNDKLARSKMKIALDYINNSKLDKKECVLIGDSIHDYEVATEMGIDCILVSTGHTSKKRLETCPCPIIDDLKELDKYLKI